MGRYGAWLVAELAGEPIAAPPLLVDWVGVAAVGGVPEPLLLLDA